MKLILTYPDGIEIEARTAAGLIEKLKDKSPFTREQSVHQYLVASSARYHVMGYPVRSTVLGYLVDLHMLGLAKLSIHL